MYATRAKVKKNQYGIIIPQNIYNLQLWQFFDTIYG